MKKYRLYQVDSFTKNLFKGNPAGVVTNADGLTDQQMHQIARELNNSETAFILNPTAKDHHVRIRFFTPSTEVPSCGHATIAAHYVRAKELDLDSSIVVQKIGAGILPVEIIKEGDDYKIVMTQGKTEFLGTLNNKNKMKLLTALNISLSDLIENCPIEIVSTGHSKVIIGIKKKSVLDSLNPNLYQLSQISKKIECNGFFIFTINKNEKTILTSGRMFAPAIGINEDPVTGNANGPLGAYLIKHNLVQYAGEELKFFARQGESIGRSGIAEVTVIVGDKFPKSVKVGGYARIVFDTEIEI